MNITKYVRQVTPGTVEDVLDPKVLQNLLNGYSYALNSGITMLLPGGERTTSTTIQRHDALRLNPTRSYNHLCAYWRGEKGCGREDACVLADKTIAQRFFEGTWDKPRLYRCAPLSLWDMAYPIKVADRVVGVLFGGQIILKQRTSAWRKAIGGCDIQVDSSLPDNHRRAVIDAINAGDATDEQKKRLVQLVKRDKHHESLSLSAFRKRIEDFLNFGQLTQGLIASLYDSQRTAAEQELLTGLSQELTQLDLSNPEQWWRDCHHLMCQLVALPEIESTRLYVRDRSRYNCKGLDSEEQSTLAAIPAHQVVSALQPGQLTQLTGPTHSELLGRLGLGQDHVWAFRSANDVGRERSGTLILLHGPILLHRRSFLEGLCKVVTTASDAARLSHQQRIAEESYRLQVKLIAHSFRTPLQALKYQFEQLNNTLAKVEVPGLSELTAAAQARIDDAKEDVTMLLETAQEDLERVDVLEVLKKVVETMKPIAFNHPCTITVLPGLPHSAVVRANRYRLRRALTCLADNAVKYSYRGRSGSGDLYDVRIECRADTEHVHVALTNYGIGIAKDLLAAIEEHGLEYGQRQNVFDEKKLRLGTGLGLRFAIETCEAYGGWVVVRSAPARSASASEIAEYHRYVTFVEAVLPIVSGGNT
jgi:signal transduction histidine kinase